MPDRRGVTWTDEECGEYRRLLRVLYDAQIDLHQAGNAVDAFLRDHPTEGWMDVETAS